jgi:hypothetical protein
VAVLAFCDDPIITVGIYVDTSKEVGDADHLKLIDPEGVAFEYEVME